MVIKKLKGQVILVTGGTQGIGEQIAEGQPGNWLQLAEARQPFGRLINTRDVANAVLFLISADSGVMTGSVIDFDQTIIGAYD